MAVAWLLLAPWGLAAAAGPPAATRSPTAGPHPAAPEETAQFGFLIGEKRCTTRNMQPDGTYADAGEAEWNGRYILDGWAIEDEWIKTLPDGTVFRGINIRSFNPETRKWDNRWLATGSLQWKYFEAEQVGDTMVMIGGEGEDFRGPFVDRNTFSEIREGGFDWRKDRSWDGGESWIEGVARIECRSPTAG
ncbi:MAG: hypothetical protein OES32_09840 [Acidobacteriota bacterium]|nr:hypothetical protein [Acidobacteriota bacterium]